MLRILILGLVLAAVAAPAGRRVATGAADGVRRCTLAPGHVRAVLYVERDTMMPFARSEQRALSFSTPPGMARDSMLATPDTPMPSARVRLLKLDSASRALFASFGITDLQPRVYIQAAPYRADCRTVRWTDSVPWTQVGDTGYVVATLTSRDHWIDGAPMLVIADAWSYPYPRQSGLLLYPPARPPYASADALFRFEDRVSQGRDLRFNGDARADTARTRAIAWAREHVEQREREPIRSRIGESVSFADFAHVQSVRSRLRGTYRIQLRNSDTSATWLFRTVDRPAYRWLDVDTARTIADLIDSPFVAGYKLVAYAADSAGMVPVAPPRRATSEQLRLVWLAAADRPTAPGNDTTRALTAMLEFQRKSAPRAIWQALDAYVPALSAMDSVYLARLPVPRTRADDQPRLPLTLRVGRDGSVSADTTIVRDGQRLRVTLTRVDTVAVARPF